MARNLVSYYTAVKLINKGNIADSGSGPSDIVAERKALLERLEEGDFAPLVELFPAQIRPLAARVPRGPLNHPWLFLGTQGTRALPTHPRRPGWASDGHRVATF